MNHLDTLRALVAAIDDNPAGLPASRLHIVAAAREARPVLAGLLEVLNVLPVLVEAAVGRVQNLCASHTPGCACDVCAPRERYRAAIARVMTATEPAEAADPSATTDDTRLEYEVTTDPRVLDHHVTCEVMFGRHGVRGGTVWEAAIRWQELGRSPVPRLEAFYDAWGAPELVPVVAALREITRKAQDRDGELTGKQASAALTPAALIEMLKGLGFQDAKT